MVLNLAKQGTTSVGVGASKAGVVSTRIGGNKASRQGVVVQSAQRQRSAFAVGVEKKELFCVAKEQNADGSTLFKFSNEKPAVMPATEEPAPAAAPAPVEAEVKEEAPPVAETPKPQVDVVPAVIIGAGRVGQALAAMGGGKDVILKRGDAFPSDAPAGPIIVCTRNDVLDDLVFSIPVGRWGDLVFLQNGVLQPWLEEKGLQKCTQMLAYFAVAKLGETPTDGKTELNPEGLTSITGKWGDAVAERLHSAGLSCHVLNKDDYDVRMFEKLIWICSFMVVGASNGGCSVGEVCDNHRSDLSDVIGELSNICTSKYGTVFPSGLVDRLVAYGRSVAHFPTAVKELEWRNGFFYKISQDAIKAGAEDPAPFHTKLLSNLAQLDAKIRAGLL